MTTATTQIFFNVGTKLEFNNDGDICEVVGNFKIRNKYKIIYRSLKSFKKYSDTRNDLITWLNDGILTVK